MIDQYVHEPTAYIQLDGVAVSEAAALIYRDVLRVPYVLTPELVGDKRPVTILISTHPATMGQAASQYLGSVGVDVTTRGEVAVLGRSSPGGSAYASAAYPSPPPGAPLSWSGGGSVSHDPLEHASTPAGPPPPPAIEQIGLYNPRFRTVAYLVDLLRSALPGLSLGSRGGVQAQGDTTLPQSGPDVLLIAGTHADVTRAMGLLPQLDTEQHQLMLVATVYEVSTGSSQASALSIAVGLLGNGLSGGSLVGTPGLDSFVKLVSGDVSAVFSALSGDSRFRSLSAPSLLVRSGSEAVLSSGSQVPVLGAITLPQDGQPATQSVEYRDSGVTLRVRPTVHQDTIDLDIAQELSSFVRTETGVNGSPTLNRRALTNRLTVRSGEIVILGGLKEEKDTRRRSGLLPGLLGSKSRETVNTEVILVLQAVRLGDGEERARSVARTRAAPRLPG